MLSQKQLGLKEKIITSAIELFIRFGIRSVTMDDVAKEISVSKKTVYQYFQNKDAMVTDVVTNYFVTEREEFETIKATAKDAIHELILTSKCIRRHVFKMNPAFLLDMQKFHNKAWEEYLWFKQTIIKGQIRENISRGIAEKFFRKEMDSEIISIFRVESVQLLFDPKIFPIEKYDFPTVQLQIMDHFINGLLTKEGRKKYQEYNESERLEMYITN